VSIVRLVRHGAAAAAYSEHTDPGLSSDGRTQAAAVAEGLALLGSQLVVSSPMARARETAAPLAERWQREVLVEPAVSEIPSPGLSPAQRGPWLQALMAGTWSDASSEIRAWRDAIAATVLALDVDAVVFSHYVAINAAISVALDTDTPRCRHLDHCSVTVFDTTGGVLRLVEAGTEAETRIL